MEPDAIPTAVVAAICKAWPDQAAEILQQIKWNHDHWYIQRWGMYVGIEPDGYIHT